MTIFGVPWDRLDLAALQQFLAEAELEPLLWEAKGIEAKAGEVRRQVCGFANSHDGGYLIIGAAQADDGSWGLEGVEFPDEPPAWVANVVGNGGVNPYPDGLDVKSLPAAEGKHVAVVRVPSVPTPPCNAHGTVYERVSGRTISVREPLRLAQLFARGDQARRDAHEKAEAVATQVLVAGRQVTRFNVSNVQFGLGLAATGYMTAVSSRLFGEPFEERVATCLGGLDFGPVLGGRPRIEPSVTQDARQFVSEGSHNLLGRSWVVNANWHGAVGIYWIQGVDSDRIDSIVNGPIKDAWGVAEDLLVGLGAQGSRYLQLVIPEGTLTAPFTTVGRGPLPPGTNQTVLASIERELHRARGEMAYEAETPLGLI